MQGWKTRFFTIWVGQQFSLFGSSIAQFALIWWLTQKTGSATVLATASLVAMIPGVALGPFAGTFVDRWNRRWVMILADGLIAFVSLILAFLFWTGKVEIWHIYLVKIVRGFGGAFHWPAMTASTSLMVPKQHLSRVAGLNQTMQGLRNIVCPPVAAMLLSALPIHIVLGIDVLTAMLAITPLFFIPIQPEAPKIRPSYFRELAGGFRYIWSWRGALYLLLGVTILNALLTPAFSLIPLLITKHFGKGALELGWMESAFGFGVIGGGLVLSIWGGFKRRIYTSLIGMIGMGLGTVFLGVAPPAAFYLALGAMAWIGIMNPITNGPLTAILQTAVAPEVQGRVFSLLGSLAELVSPLGLALAGPIADLFGVQVWFLLGGLGLIFMGTVGFFIPSLVHIEEGPKQQNLSASERFPSEKQR